MLEGAIHVGHFLAIGRSAQSRGHHRIIIKAGYSGWWMLLPGPSSRLDNPAPADP